MTKLRSGGVGDRARDHEIEDSNPCLGSEFNFQWYVAICLCDTFCSAKMQKATFGWLFRVKQVSKNRVQCFEVHQGCQYLGFEANPGFS